MHRLFYNINHQVRLIWRFLLFLVLSFIINTPFQIGIREVMEDSILRGNLSGIFVLVSIFFSLFIQMKYLDGSSSLSKYGLIINKKWLLEFSLGLGIAALQLIAFFGLMIATGNLTIEEYFTTSSTSVSFLQGIVAEFTRQFSVASSEEMLFRSFLFFMVFEGFTRAGKHYAKSAIIACLIISPFFGIAHFANEGASIFSSINLMFDALIICLPFLISGRLGMSIGMHFSWNLIQGAVLGFANSGHIAKASFIHSSLLDNIWTGGTFGPEGSVLLLILDLLALGIILLWKKNRKYTHWVHPKFKNY